MFIKATDSLGNTMNWSRANAAQFLSETYGCVDEFRIFLDGTECTIAEARDAAQKHIGEKVAKLYKTIWVHNGASNAPNTWTPKRVRK
jgi:hypothetical protein